MKPGSSPSGRPDHARLRIGLRADANAADLQRACRGESGRHSVVPRPDESRLDLEEGRDDHEQGDHPGNAKPQDHQHSSRDVLTRAMPTDDTERLSRPSRPAEIRQVRWGR
jgi:hypothetical protein